MNTLKFLLEQNTLEQLLYALGAALIALFALITARRVLVARLHRISRQTSVIWDDVLADVLASTKLPFMIWLSVLAGLTQIRLPADTAALPYKAMMILLIVQAGIWAARAVASWVELRLEASRKAGDGAAVTNFGVISFILRVLVWVVTLLSLLDNLGVNITTLVASLGIGGIAVALAVQNILGDLLASLSIALDKPFVVGDAINVDGLTGTVTHVGLKTTRVQSTSGEELVFANNDLLKSRVRNYKRMNERRIVFGFGLTYDTPPDALRELPGALRGIVEATPGTRFDRAHFKAFGASSLDFEVVYVMLTPDYLAYMDAQQAINLALLEHCNARGLAFAFPTQTLHVQTLPAPADAPAPG
ncbi:MAG: mechanosensitive ion channel family protein [Candidatus Dactylopiibacterium sp.]|nr:mechanosensitive ion channel family protein [Candidatus Dactylopiibacterium sp.]